MRVQAFAALRYVAHLLAARAFAAGAPVRLRRGLSATYLRTTVEAHRVQCGGLMEHDAADPGLFSPAAVDREDRAGGSAALRSRHPLSPCPAAVVEVFAARAREHPERVLVAQRDGGGWRVLPWGEAAAQVEAVAPSLLDRGVAGRPVMILSGNSIEHLLLTLAAFTVGSPAVPVSVAYSLQSRDHEKPRTTRWRRPGVSGPDAEIQRI